MKKFFILLFFTALLFASTLNEILYKIALKNDLSNETKKENSGILYIITRQDINSLQITHLRDLLKLLPLGYKFNRFGIIDPFNPNTNIPFLSSPIKIFIDNQEVVSGFYNSGLALLDDIDLGWVDHIEVYSQSPSYDITTEPSFIVIKLYTKRACRDEGNDIYLNKGKKSSLVYFQKAEHTKYPYYFYISKNDEKSDYHNSRKRNQVLLHIYNKDSSLILYALKSHDDGLFGFSMDGNVNDSFIKNNYFHLGYNRKWDNFTFYMAADVTRNKTFYYETPLLFVYDNYPIKSVYVKSFDRVLDFGVKFKKEIEKNIFLFGIKSRFKYFNWDKLRFNNMDIPQTSRDTQNVYGGYLELSRFLRSNSMVNFGYSYSYFRNSGGIINQKTNQFRISHTFLKNHYVFKTCYSHTEYTMDPYLINSIYVAKNILKPVKIDDVFENIKYKTLFKEINLILGFFISKNYFFPNSKGLLDNSPKRIKEHYFGFRYDYSYRPFSKLSFDYFFHYMSDIPQINNYKVHRIIVYNYDNFKNRWNVFEELVASKETHTKFYYNLSLGAKYYVNENLTFLLKGENLLDKGVKYNFFSYDPINNKFNSPIKVSLIERRVILGMEYSF